MSAEAAAVASKREASLVSKVDEMRASLAGGPGARDGSGSRLSKEQAQD